MRKLISMILSLILINGCLPCSAASQMPSVINASIVGDVEYKEYAAQSCAFLETSSDVLAVRASDAIDKETENLALRIVYLDNGSNYIRVRWKVRSSTIVERIRLIHKSASGKFKEAIILINRGLYDGSGTLGEDFLIDSYDTRNGRYSEYISKIELIDLSSMGLNEENGKKKNILYKSSGELLSELELLPKGSSEDVASLSDINYYFEKITGMESNVSEATMESVLSHWLTILGYSASGDIKNRATEAGLIRSVGYSPAFFGRASGREMQNFGVGTICFDIKQKVFYDDLAGLLYNLLFMKKNTSSDLFMAQMAQKDSSFKEKLLSLNDYLLLNAYYDNQGIEISEKEITDSLTGEKMTCLYMKGNNVNTTYVNEYSSVDGENYILCAAFDKRQGIGTPVIYNTKTKTTVELSRNGGISPFAIVMARDNVAYWTEGEKLYSYNVLTGDKKIVFTEPDGAVLQDVPTVTNDGKYITVFCGKTITYHPDTIYRINTHTGDYEVIVNSEWVNAHFAGSENPHAGHIIINPENPEIVNFMHGGGTNVTDRLWLYDNGDIYQPYIQKMKDANNNYFGEHITHAFWSLDGNRLYFLRPPASSDSVENGITYVDINEAGNPKTARVLNGDFSYIHTSVDKADKHFVSDTQIVYDKGQFRNEIVLYSDISHQAYLLCYVPLWNSHPCHSHPTFTSDGKKVVFNRIDEENENSMVAVMEVEETIKKLDAGELDKQGEIAWLSPDASYGLLNIEGTQHIRTTINDEKCIGVVSALGIEVFGSIVPKNENNVAISIRYFDNGTENINIQYNTNSSSEFEATKNRKQISLERMGSNEWKEAVIELQDASFRSANADNTDFKILPGGSDEVYISNLAVFSGKAEGYSYSEAYFGKDSVYIPVLNMENEEKEVILIADNLIEYKIKNAVVDAKSFKVIKLSLQDAKKIYVWNKNLMPAVRRNSK